MWGGRPGGGAASSRPGSGVRCGAVAGGVVASLEPRQQLYLAVKSDQRGKLCTAPRPPLPAAQAGGKAGNIRRGISRALPTPSHPGCIVLVNPPSVSHSSNCKTCIRLFLHQQEENLVWQALKKYLDIDIDIWDDSRFIFTLPSIFETIIRSCNFFWKAFLRQKLLSNICFALPFSRLRSTYLRACFGLMLF